MEYFNLNNGVKMPAIGFGVFQIPKEETVQAVLDAIEVGYRKFDTAQSYQNEEELGQALKESGLPREEFFLTTKVWLSNYGYEKTQTSIEISMKKLQTDYLDLVLLHQPFGDYYGAYRALVDLQKTGKIRAIGVSNFYPDRLSDLVAFSDQVPQVNQIEINPFFIQEDAVQNMNVENVLAESWGPFREGRDQIFTHPTLVEIGKKYQKSVAQVILRWLFQRGIASNCKSVKKERMAENFAIFDFALTEDDIASIQEMDTDTSLFMDHRTVEAVKLFKDFVESRGI
ncbi:aldo/keto reductase [Streptococcus sp. ZY1909104]|uniref:aldo/keto reductase n=1 Tax=Streptococcus sp. ZY1909104 TaxID=3233335 RepID=UPI00349FC035